MSPPDNGQEPIKVLLIDDQIIIGEAVRRLLAGEDDIRFRHCSDPRQAFDAALEFQPTVILQDLVMPEIDGITLVKRFREHEATRIVPMIVLSTREEPETKAEAFAVGANDYLVKLPSGWNCWRASATTPTATSTGSSATKPTGSWRRARRPWPKRSPRPRSTSARSCRGRSARGPSGPIGASSPPPPWGETPSATTGSTRIASPSTCSTSSATGSARRSSRSRS
jgi:CheY-like chemotaxis protein